MPLIGDEGYLDEFHAQYKTRNAQKHSKYNHSGHTLRNLKRRDCTGYNTECLMTQHNLLDAKSEQTFEAGSNLLLFTKEENNKYIFNKPFNSTVNYSLNKKKRWLLANLVTQRTQTQEFKKTKSTETTEYNKKSNKTLDENDNWVDFTVTAFFHEPTVQSIRTMKLNEYHDNFGTHQIGAFNMKSFQHHLSEPPLSLRFRRWSPEKKKPPRRIKFKYGNRNRNTGIQKRNTQTTQTTENVWNRDIFNNNDLAVVFNFSIPRKIYKCSRGFNRKLTKYFCYFGRRKNGGYESKLVKKFRIPQSFSNLCKHEFKHKKYDLFHNTLKDELIDYPFYELDTSLLMSSLTSKQIDIDFSSENVVQIRLKDLNKSNEPCLKPLKPNSNFTEKLFGPKNKLLFSVEKTEMICFDFKEDINLIESNNNGDNNKQPSQTVSEPMEGIFKSYFFKAGLDFRKSVEIFVRDNRDLVRIHTSSILVDLKSLALQKTILDQRTVRYSELSAFLIYDLYELDQYLVNMNFKNFKHNSFEFSEEKQFFETFDSLISEILIRISSLIDSSFPSHEKEAITCVPKVYLFGEVSYMDQKTLIELNRSILSGRIEFDEDLIFTKNCFSSEKKTLELCDICYDELEYPVNFFELRKCGHRACLNCWRAYLSVTINEMKTNNSSRGGVDDRLVKPLCCLSDKCNVELRLDQLYRLVSTRMVEKYVQYYTDLSVIRQRDKYAYCGNKRCDKIIVLEGGDVSEFIKICACGFMVCRHCLQEAHFPSLCKQAQMYLKDVKKLEEMKVTSKGELYTSEGKNCPNCNNYMEKNSGCNHMSCPCGFHFCWLCLKEYFQYHSASDGYYCKNEKKELVVHGSHEFMSFKFSLMSVKVELAQIMQEFRLDRAFKLKTLDASVLTLSSEITIALFKRMKSMDLESKVLYCERTLSTRFSQILKEYERNNNNSSLLSTSIKAALHDELVKVKFNIEFFHAVIEYLALLLSSPSSFFKIAEYSFKGNMYKSLKKAIVLRNLILDAFDSMNKGKKSNTTSAVQLFGKILFLNERIVGFISNLKHFTVEILKIYEKYAIKN